MKIEKKGRNLGRQRKTWGLRGILFLVLLASSRATSEESRFTNYRQGFQPDVMALQILLDRTHLSCNCIDGVWGTRTEIALMTWQLLQQQPVTGVPTAAILEQLGGTTNLFQYYEVTAADHAGLGPVPTTWEARSLLKSMSYETLQELLAEKGHLSQRALVRLNPTVPWPAPPIGTQIILPIIMQERLPIATALRISLSRRELTAFSAQGTLIALFPCSIARDPAKQEALTTRVKVVAPNPNYTYNPQLFNPGGHESKRLIIPPGPNNPVGMAWIGLERQGYGIHGTPIPENIGRAESLGCFRLTNWNAQKLLKMVEIGTTVIVEE